MGKRVEHWFNRRYGMNRRDVFLIRTPTGWQVVGRQGGAEGSESTHYLDHEPDARAMLQRMLDTVPPELANWRQMTTSAARPSR